MFCIWLARGEIKSLRVEPCVSEPCNFRVGDRVTVILDFVANHNASKVSLQGTLSTGGFFNYETVAPGLDTQACGPESYKLKCPIVAGQNYTFSYIGYVPLASRFNVSSLNFFELHSWIVFHFQIFRTSTWKLVGENYRTLTCAEIPLK